MKQAGIIDDGKGPVLLTHSGRKVPVLNPQEGEFVITDLAFHLARQRRFSGAGISVAQHSVLVMLRAMELGAGAEVQLAALLHDAAEFLTGDFPAPVKQAFRILGAGQVLDLLELRFDTAIRDAFGLPELKDWSKALIHRCDMEVRAAEMRDLYPERARAWLKDLPEPWPLTAISFWGEDEAESEFVEAFNRRKAWLDAEAQLDRAAYRSHPPHMDGAS